MAPVSIYGTDPTDFSQRMCIGLKIYIVQWRHVHQYCKDCKRYKPIAGTAATNCAHEAQPCIAVIAAEVPITAVQKKKKC
jgi:hypothetical protein